MVTLSAPRLSLAAVGGALITLLAPLQVLGQGRPPVVLPQGRPQVFDPDPGSCVAEKMRATFQRQLEPFQDQGEAVLQQLRVVQAEITLASLRRCVQRGLMPEEEAIRLARELGLISAAGQGASASTRP